MKLRDHYEFAIACLTSMGVRITPEDRMQTNNSRRFYMQATSAETNVLNIAASLHLPVLAMTRFVKDSPIALLIQSELRSRGINYIGREISQGGPWGYRHQFNIADSGYGMRAPRVWNDRAGEVGRTLSSDDFDLEEIFIKKGVGILHLSGLIAAMSEETTACCLELARFARGNGTLVSFDLNYRDSFWKGREEELGKAFRELAGNADILSGNEEDFQLCLGIQGPETGGKDLKEKVESFRRMILDARKAFPGVSVFTTTLRQVLSANRHLWGAVMSAGEDWFVEEPREIEVLDRIGGGDGFMSGLLYALVKGYEPEEWIRFGWAGGVMAASSLNDYAEPADEKQLRDIYKGNARVQR